VKGTRPFALRPALKARDLRNATSRGGRQKNRNSQKHSTKRMYLTAAQKRG
jgi:hypothetical protein